MWDSGVACILSWPFLRERFHSCLFSFPLKKTVLSCIILKIFARKENTGYQELSALLAEEQCIKLETFVLDLHFQAFSPFNLFPFIFHVYIFDLEYKVHHSDNGLSGHNGLFFFFFLTKLCRHRSQRENRVLFYWEWDLRAKVSSRWMDTYSQRNRNL